MNPTFTSLLRKFIAALLGAEVVKAETDDKFIVAVISAILMALLEWWSHRDRRVVVEKAIGDTTKITR